MALGSGLDTQVGMKKETTYGTPVTVDRFNFVELVGVTTEVGKIETPTLGTLVLRTSSVKTYTSGAGGDILYPVMNKGMGVLFQQCFGTSVSAQVGATTEYTQTHTLDLTGGKRGMSATVQAGKASVDGTVNPFTWEGGKVVGFNISMDEMGALKVTPSWVFEDVKTATALATASYATTPEMFTWDTASVTLGGVAVFVRSFNVAVAFSMNVDRRGLSQTLRKEPIVNGLLGITGAMVGEFEAMTHYTSFLAGTQQALVFTVTGSTIAGAANPHKIVITIPKVDLLAPGEPSVSGPEILEQPLNFRGLYDGSTAPITMVQNTSDTAL